MEHKYWIEVPHGAHLECGQRKEVALWLLSSIVIPVEADACVSARVLGQQRRNR